MTILILSMRKQAHRHCVSAQDHAACKGRAVEDELCAYCKICEMGTVLWDYLKAHGRQHPLLLYGNGRTIWRGP